MSESKSIEEKVTAMSMHPDKPSLSSESSIDKKDTAINNSEIKSSHMSDALTDDKETAVTATSTTMHAPITVNNPSAVKPVEVKPNHTVIKNKSGVGSMLKMVFITLSVFAATVAVGVGVGIGVLNLSQKSGGAAIASPSPSAIAQVTPSPVASPSAAPVASASGAIDKAKSKILVVNATTTPGYAGKTKSALEKSGYKNVSAGNAKGDYDGGFLVLLETNDPALVSQLAKESGLSTLKFNADKDVEDPKGEYAAVIVLAE